MSGVDTRALTRLVRREGPPTVAFAHRRRRRVRPRGAAAAGGGLAGARGHGPRQGGQPRAARSAGRAASGSSARAMRMARRATTTRPHVVAIDYGSKRNIFRNLVEAGARVTIVPGDGQLRRGDGARARRLLPLQRPRRPGRDRRICGAGDPAAAGDGQAAVRHLPRPPVAGARGRRQDREDVPGPPRRQPPGQAARATARSRSPA